MISYTVTPASPEAHLFEVVLVVENPDEKGQQFQMPAWIPGSYMIRDFAKNIVQISGTDSLGDVAHVKVDKQTWHFSPCEGALTVKYQVYAWDLSVRGAHLDTTHGYFNGTSLFLRTVGQEGSPCHVEINKPDRQYGQGWKIATTLPPHGDNRYKASGYEELIDHPVEMGTYTEAHFDVAGVPHEVIITGKHDTDLNRLTEDLKAICEAQVAMFGELPHMAKYQFQVLVVGDGYGGLEHRSSTSLICSRKDLPYSPMDKTTEGYRRFLGLCSHEYFHLWNVKRIRPKVLMDSDLMQEAYTRLLWVFEGFTSYYDDLFLLRSGRVEVNDYLELLAGNITLATRGSGPDKQSVTDSSFDAWTKLYKQDENAPNAIVSYYTKGSVIALLLDLILRKQSGNQCSLDDVMRALWCEHGKLDIGLKESDAEALIQRVAGLDLTEFFDRALRSTDELPIADLLSEFGIGCEYRAALSGMDRGGIRKPKKEVKPPKAVLGVRYKRESIGVRLTHVLDGGAAQQFGLSAGDHIIAIDGLSFDASDFDELVARRGPKHTARVHAFRRDELMRFDVQPMLAAKECCELWVLSELDSDRQKLQSSWLTVAS